MKVVVVGAGYVGLVTGVCLAYKNHKVVCLDKNESRIEMLKNGIVPIYEPSLEELMNKSYTLGNLSFSSDYKNEYKDADIILVAVGTPENEDGSANLEYVYKVANEIANTINKDCTIVIKSTVPIGTNDELEKYINEHLKNNVNIEVVSNPEFLSQGTAVKDTLEASRIIIGTESEISKKVMKKLYKDFDVPIVFMSRRSSEMVKYASNCFLALKISYINDIANLCEIIGADIQEVTKGMSYDARIGEKFLNAGCGYGGSCFPKDTKALHYLANKNGYSLKSIENTIEINKKQKVILLEKAKKKYNNLKDKNIAILGMTFKPNTDDLRKAPAIENIEILLEEGANITVYDPKAMDKVKKRYASKIEYAASPQEALKDSDACFIFTEWDEIKNVKVEEYSNLMKEPVVFDGRNIYSVNEMKNSGVEYYSVGRGDVNI